MITKYINLNAPKRSRHEALETFFSGLSVDEKKILEERLNHLFNQIPPEFGLTARLKNKDREKLFAYIEWRLGESAAVLALQFFAAVDKSEKGIL